MDTRQILNDLSHLCCKSKKKKNFAVLPADFLPKKVPTRPFYLVINTSASNEGPGEHWVCMYVPAKSSQSIEYFDSFGLPALNKHFRKFIKNNCTHYIYNKVQLQSNISTVCGEFCVVFLTQRCCEKKNLQQFINQFSTTKLEMNDAKVTTMYNKLQKQKKKPKTASQLGHGHLENSIVCNQTCVSREHCIKQIKQNKYKK